MFKSRRLWLSAVILLIALGIFFDLHTLITLDAFKTQQAVANAWVTEEPMLAAVTYFFSYILIAALNIPGAAVMTLIGGALFGLTQGSVLVSFASSIGAKETQDSEDSAHFEPV